MGQIVQKRIVKNPGCPGPKSCTRCREQDMGRVISVSNGFGTTTETFSNTISIPLAIAGSRHRAG